MSDFRELAGCSYRYVISSHYSLGDYIIAISEVISATGHSPTHQYPSSGTQVYDVYVTGSAVVNPQGDIFPVTRGDIIRYNQLCGE